MSNQNLDINFCCAEGKLPYVSYEPDHFLNAEGYGKQETAEILETITLPERTKKNDVPKGKNTTRKFTKGDRIFGEDIDGKYFRFRIFGGVADYRYYFIPKTHFKTLGAKKEYRKEILGSIGSRVFRRTKGGLLASPRAAYLIITELNVFNTAAKLAKVKKENKTAYEKVLLKWYKLGGRKEALDKAVERGKTKNAILGKSQSKFKNFDGGEYLNSTGSKATGVVGATAGGTAAVAGIIAATASNPALAEKIVEAAAIVGAINGVLSGVLGELDKSKEEQDVVNLAQQQSENIINSLPADDITKAKMNADLKSGMSIDEVFIKYGVDTGRDSAIGTWGWVGIIGGGAILIGTILYFSLRK